MTAPLSGSTQPMLASRSPQCPDDLVAEAAAVSPATVEVLARQARSAQASWWHQGAAARSAVLRAVADRLRATTDELVDLVVREVGKPVIEARGELARSAAILDYYAQSCFAAVGEMFPPSLPATQPGLLFTERRPYGVAGLITPWNFPLAIPLWKAAPALAAGNAVLLKPSPDALACGQAIARLFAGLVPDGLLAVVPGGAETGRAIVEASDVLSFTGSVTVGRQVVATAARRGRPVQAEMGGQNAAIVLPDADLAETAAMLAGATMGYAGQKCTATRRIIVVGDSEPFTEALVAAVVALTVGDPADPAVTVGPVITAAARARVRDAVASARAAGARVLTGERTLPEGYYVAPVLVDRLDPAHALAQEETFGPLAAILSAPDVTTAVALANNVPYGLVTSVHGRDVGALLQAARGADTGLVRVNAPTTGVDFYAPFGGEKASSIGPREQGLAALDFYASTRTITLAAPPAATPSAAAPSIVAPSAAAPSIVAPPVAAPAAAASPVPAAERKLQ
ncbi:aldehyde dehydrogenase family protein [Micromonospora polyrhachis]|uniref:Aldehyde dehydrogenase (NAD+) n=1 Tax=Micromonospora polyrhachis TaxID=1282883 RepID=A0A7W7SMF1_9ACTN|nr:aldehyde dehydrogenase family protein [Micromonospora polyrhachis]MBB4956907.1 aldehyde dehydrogenase (NAD+) [Micromonospora polyrhachis]